MLPQALPGLPKVEVAAGLRQSAAGFTPASVSARRMNSA